MFVSDSKRNQSASHSIIERYEFICLYKSTGDNALTAKAIGDTLGVEVIASRILPQDKEKHIRDLQAQGHRVVGW